MKVRIVSVLLLIHLWILQGLSQSNLIEGYTFETGNRGYLSKVAVEVIDAATSQTLLSTESDIDGKFSLDLPPVTSILLKFRKELFEEKEMELTLSGTKQFLKVEMVRAPGYLFEITLADKREDENTPVDAIRGALIEVYNNTTEELVLKLEDHPDPEFKLPMQKGNHYTILVRKKGYLAKQMEAYVNVRGCILCFEGISDVRPGVTENLTSGNSYGTLLSNVEMEKVFSGKSFEVQDIYYDLNSAALKKESKVELDKVINLLRYNPNLTLELGSHTDSRGKDDFNMELSEKRAKSAVQYITDVGGIPKFRIIAAGYGETLLKNECGDGVKCSEAKHQENRRTEIRIVGINEDWVFKPLVNIKNEIKMEKELYEMIHGKSEQLSEEQYKELKEKEKESASPISESVLEEGKDAGQVSQMQEDNKITTEDYSIVEIEAEDSTDNVDSTISSNEEIDMPDDPVLEGLESKSKPAISDGYKIIIHFSGVPLDETNPIFDKYEDLEVYESPENKYYYMLPGYQSTSEAEQALTNGVLAVYPSAYVAGFKNGRRIL